MLYFLKHNDIKTTVLFAIVCMAIATLSIGCPAGPADTVDTIPPALSIQISDVSASNGQVSFLLTNSNNEMVEGRISVEPAPPSDAIYTVDGSVIEGDVRISLASADSDGAIKQIQITQLNNGTEYTITIITIDTAGNAQRVTDTTSQTPGFEYICANGVATAGIAAAENSERCNSCATGHALSGAADAEGTVCLAMVYACEHGTPIPGRPTTTNTQGCATCNNGYYLSAEPGAGAACIENAYSCQNGTPIPGVPLSNGAAGCAACDIGYRLSATAAAGTTCLADAHGNILMDATDITLNSRISGRINTTDDIDVFSFSVNSGTIFRVYTTGSTDTDGTVRLSADAAEIVATDDDSGTNTNFDILATNSTALSQLYYVEVRGSQIGNYELAVEEILSTGADLAIASASISVASVRHGGSTTISTVIENKGIGTSASTILRYYLSADIIISTDDSQLSHTNMVPTLPPNGTSTVDYETTIDSSMLGTFYIGACVDVVGGEANNSNNCSTGILLTISDDHGDTRTDATTVIDGSSTTGSIDSSSDVDYFAIEIADATTLTALITGPPSTIGKIFDSGGAQIDERDDLYRFSNQNFHVGYDIVTAGTYYIEVSSHRSRTGDYTLMIDLFDDDHGDTPADATTVTDGSSTIGRIDSSSDVDYFAIEIAGSTTLAASTTGSLDTIGRILSSDGEQLASHNNIHFHIGNRNFLVAYDIMAAGTYYIEVSSDLDDIGEYTLVVDLIDDDHSSTRADATSVTNGSSTTGRIDPGNDVDYFTIELASAGVLTASTTGSLNTIGKIFDNNGVQLAEHDDVRRFVNQNFRVRYHAMVAGTYYIEVSSNRADMGEYTLVVEFDDHGNTRANATSIPSGSTTAGRIDSGNDVDYFAIEIPGTTTLTAFTTGSLNTIGKIFNSNGIELAEHDNIHPFVNKNFRIGYDVVAAGTYYIEVSSHRADMGEYTLMVELVDDDHGDRRADATPVTDGSSTAGRIDSSSDVDYFAIEVTGTTRLAASTTGSLDTVGRIFNSDGREVAYHDNIDFYNGYKNFLVTHDIVKTGTYYIEVSGYHDDIGEYTLVVDLIDDDHGDTRADATPIINGSSTTAKIDPSNDVDYFAIEVMGTGALTASTTGSVNTIGKIFDSDGKKLAEHDNIHRGSNHNFRVAYDVVTAGTYYIEVSSYRASMGEYTLMVDLVSDDHGDTRTDATSVTDGSSTAGRIGLGDDVDYFVIQVPNATTLTASTTGSLNTIGKIFDNSGTKLAEHDNVDYSRAGQNFLVAYDIVTAGTYYIEVSSFLGTIGEYTLMVDLVSDDHGDTRADATAVADGSSTTGRIGSSSDVDYFKIEIPGATTLAAFTTGSLNAIGKIFDSSGTKLAEHDNIHRFINQNFLVTYDIIAAGTYYIEVSGVADNIDNYTLRVDLVDDDHGDTPADATPVANGSSTTGTIDPGIDVDYFAITIPGTGTLTASTTGSFDTVGTLFDDTGKQLALHDNIDRTSNKNFLVAYDIMAAGTYYIEVSSHTFDTTIDIGNYTLVINFTQE